VNTMMKKWISDFGVKSRYGLRIALIYSLIMMTLNNLYNAFQVGVLPGFIYLLIQPVQIQENMLVASIAGLIAIVLASAFFYIYFRFQKSGYDLYQRPKSIVAISSLILGIVVWAHGGMTLLLRFFVYLSFVFYLAVPNAIVKPLYFFLSAAVCSIVFLLLVAKLKGDLSPTKRLKDSLSLILVLSLIATILIMVVSWLPNNDMYVNYPIYSINCFTQTFTICLIFHLIYIRLGKLINEETKIVKSEMV